MSGGTFRVVDAGAVFKPNEREIALIIKGVDARQGNQMGSFDLTIPVATALMRSLETSLHLADAMRRGVVPVAERTG